MCPRERAVARGIGVHLGAVQADRAQLEQLPLLGQLQHLHEEAREFVQKAPTKCGQRVVVRVAARGNVAKGHRSSVARSSLQQENTPVA